MGNGKAGVLIELRGLATSISLISALTDPIEGACLLIPRYRSLLLTVHANGGHFRSVSSTSRKHRGDLRLRITRVSFSVSEVMSLKATAMSSAPCMGALFESHAPYRSSPIFVESA